MTWHKDKQDRALGSVVRAGGDVCMVVFDGGVWWWCMVVYGGDVYGGVWWWCLAVVVYGGSVGV